MYLSEKAEFAKLSHRLRFGTSPTSSRSPTTSP